jgi:DNA-binding transcriptional LysR family regulator
MIPYLTRDVQRLHPQINFTIMSMSSEEILRGLNDYSIDAGITYLDNEELAHVKALPLYYERYRFVTNRTSVPAEQGSISWAEIGETPICLLTPNMQNRRIIDKVTRAAGVTLSPRLETDSTMVLLSHVQTGRWASILPAALVDMASLPRGIVSLPIIGPEVTNMVGLVVPARNPMSTLVQALFAETAQFPQQ